MSSKVPVIKQVAWISLLPQLIVMGILLFLFYYFEARDFIFNGVVSYILLSLLLRTQIPKSHRKGIRLTRAQRFDEALLYFKKSLDFFSRYAWIDRYRYLVLLSSSSISYTEMAMVNIAFCYSQTGEGEKAKQWYEKTLEVFPDSSIAQTALRMISSVGKNPATQ